jgi:hypothetical protein
LGISAGTCYRQEADSGSIRLIREITARHHLSALSYELSIPDRRIIDWVLSAGKVERFHRTFKSEHVRQSAYYSRTDAIERMRKWTKPLGSNGNRCSKHRIQQKYCMYEFSIHSFTSVSSPRFFICFKSRQPAIKRIGTPGCPPEAYKGLNTVSKAVSADAV